MANLQNQLALPHSIFETPFPAKVSKGTHYLASTMHRFHSKAITMNAIRHIDPITQEIKQEFGKVMGGETSIFHAIDNWEANNCSEQEGHYQQNQTQSHKKDKTKPVCNRAHSQSDLWPGTFIVECNGVTCTQGYLQNGKCILYKRDGFMNVWSNKDQSNKLYELADITNEQPAEDQQQYTSRQIIECKTITSVKDSIPRETNNLQTKHESPLGVTEEEKTTGQNRAAIYFEGPQELITAIGALRARECNTRDVIYSDGSLTFINGKPSLAGSVVAWDGTQKGRRINFGIEGNASSTNAEMYAANAALLGVNGPTDMYIGQHGSYPNIQTSGKKQLQHQTKRIIHTIQFSYRCPGNEMADSDANDGHMAPLLKMKLEGQSLIQFTLCTNNIMLEGNYRETLTMINKAKTFLAWIEQPAHSHIAEVQNSINFGLTFALLQRGHKQTSYFTSEAHSPQWDINAMHRLLPVQSEMRRRHQDAYPNGTCRLYRNRSNQDGDMGENDHTACKTNRTPKKRKRNENTVERQSNEANETKIRSWLKNWDGQTRDNRPPQPRDEIGSEADKMTFTHIAGYGLIPNVMYRILEKCGIRKPQTNV
ncbi:hypothetical protein BCR33DRAFT_752449 [Rhizoclosmatium globosum]|uniref:Uncharacterized protein n=1 Tax=Rhizoclosmatium globosum TaxID=329046 RepID=A0A1Y1ZFK7_9FUNG|nr:hypothetical protein BCR33DRAFT_752449 [Rhizoclosmatium globosum]|eukprot:ORY09038.1 hypothetical protein BCR33DRAFT_752449 [Rhizoclosmatium globosum]